ncbi:hypothetical protein EYC84_008586 [Monilinia fructicola]|uniref:Uncharacterized protein n=1 Tax=Monilinia fructicola TaxID=38448 RepID=A0A5M9JF40_MONFR|nr:hypothetical protein EYC84_008586 [Monilinia fructicola]
MIDPGCDIVMVVAANIITAPSSIMKGTSSLASFDWDPLASSATRNIDRISIRMVATVKPARRLEMVLASGL